MPSFKIAQVAVEGTAYHFDRPYSYRIPQSLEMQSQPGVRVVVPFGGGNRRRRGIIIAVEVGEAASLKTILNVVDNEPLLNPKMIKLAIWLKEFTCCTLYEALKPMLPAGLNLQMTKLYRINPEYPDDALALLIGDEEKIAEYVSHVRDPVSHERICEAVGLDGRSPLPDLMAAKGVLLCEESVLDFAPEATEEMIRLNITEEEAQELLEKQGATKKQKNAVKTILEAGSATVKEVMYFSGVSASVVTNLVKKGVFEKYNRRVFRDPYKNMTKGGGKTPELSPAQQHAYNELSVRLNSGEACASLLLGVTGSGKTQVFMRLIEDIRAKGRGAIVLVPEISLTPQAVARFYTRFGSDVAVLHSGLSLGERLDEWQRIKSGKAAIVVGTRSAIFAPVQSLGLIIIDEEQEHTYKSESSPRFHARDVARFRCASENAMMVLASATPSVESRFAAQTGRYAMTRIDERFGDATLPQVIMVDMKQELIDGIESPISRRLASEIEQNLNDGQQSILLINRRGYNTFVSCAQCGHVMACPNCSIALTYHVANGRLMCHYCGYSTELSTKCPECGGNYMHYAGAGTQKAQETLSVMFPQAKILRMDTDTTSGRYSHERILEKFEKEHYDILIGTQMVAKGLDFPNVTLVGVLSADQSLYIDDFRASERTFSLLTQVVGRAGRRGIPGRAVIQTQTPENEVLRLAAAQDYDAFYTSEIALRKELLYPPFCDICEVGFSGTDEAAVSSAAADFFKRIGRFITSEKNMPVRIMSPSQAGILKIAGRYRYRIIIKCKNDRRFRKIMAELLCECGKDKLYKGISVFADINPLDML